MNRLLIALWAFVLVFSQIAAFSLNSNQVLSSRVGRISSQNHVLMAKAKKNTKSIDDEILEMETGEVKPQFDEFGEILPEKKKVVIGPEEVFFEGPPSWTEVVVPAISVLTVIGIIPFAAAVSRQAWVKFKITNRRLSVTSGFGGKDQTEVAYPEIKDMKYIYRAFGAAGDVAITLRDGSKLELRSLPNFEENYRYIYSQLSPSAQAASSQIKDQEA